MPILIVNLGSEMLYVIRQRLIAQRVGKQKARRVMNEITSTMFATDFVDQLFVPTALYSMGDVLKIFHRLAHSSIMRIQEASMTKLFELMVVGVKYQILMARSEHDYLRICLCHLDILRGYVHKESEMLLDYIQEKLQHTYGMLSANKLRSLKEALYDFFAGKHVRISVLMKLQLQRPDGLMRIDLGKCCPPQIAPPGKLRVFDATGAVSQVVDLDLEVCKLGLVEFDEEIQDGLAVLGENLYTKAEYEARAPEMGDDDESDGGGEGEEKGDAVEELNVLAGMIQVKAPPDEAFHLRLGWMDDDEQELGRQSAEQPGEGAGRFGIESKEGSLVVDASVEAKSMEHMMAELGFDDRVASKCAESDDEDILELMDNACAARDEFKAA